MKVKIVRSFGMKKQVKQFEPCDWFCSVEAEVEEKDVKRMSEKLNQFCVEEVEKAEQLYMTPIEKVGKFDENAPANIKEEPVWTRYKKPYDKLHFAGNKDIKENAKTDAELSTEAELEGIS